MPKSKLEKFAQLNTFANVVQRLPGEIHPSAVKLADDQAHLWQTLPKLQEFLADPRPLILELACGYGEYSVAMAAQNPDKKFIGVDIQGERLYRGAKQALNLHLDNLLFLRIYIEELLTYLPAKSVDEIWLTFPDPYPKDRHAKRRLTGQKFLQLYQQIIKPGGLVQLKTDNQGLFDFTLAELAAYRAQVINQSQDIYAQDLGIPFLTSVQTRFEKKNLKLGKKIHYVGWRF